MPEAVQTETPHAPAPGPGGGAPGGNGTQQNAQQRQPRRDQRRQARGGKNGNRKGKGQREPNDKAFLRRANRMAKGQVAEFQKKVASALGLKEFDPAVLDQKLAELNRQRQDGMSHLERADGKARELEEQLKRQNRELNRLKKESKRAKTERQRVMDAKRAAETTADLKVAAMRAGFSDPDYALHLVDAHLSKNGSKDFDADKFFEGLKQNQKFKHLFEEREVPAGPTRGAPPSTQHQPPPARQAPQQAQDDDVERMPRHQFNQRTRDKYGFQPPM